MGLECIFSGVCLFYYLVGWSRTQHAKAPIDKLRDALPAHTLLECRVLHVFREFLLVNTPAECTVFCHMHRVKTPLVALVTLGHTSTGQYSHEDFFTSIQV